MLLRLEATTQHAPAGLREELRETQGVATQAMEELVRLARELRPAALDDLGLGAALRTQLDEFGRRAGMDAELRLPAGALARLPPDEQGVVRSEVFPGLWLDVPALLRGDLPAVFATLQHGLGSPGHAGFVARLSATSYADGRRYRARRQIGSLRPA